MTDISCVLLAVFLTFLIFKTHTHTLISNLLTTHGYTYYIIYINIMIQNIVESVLTELPFKEEEDHQQTILF